VADGIDPIADDEIVFRRIPKSMGWCDEKTRVLSPEAFGPHKTRDTTGISVAREKYKSAELAARGQPGKSYYIAVLRVGDLRQHGLIIEPRPEPDDPGHAELPQLNAANYKDATTLERKRVLVSLCQEVLGPFDTPGA
jgi:hypothetical protein